MVLQLAEQFGQDPKHLSGGREGGIVPAGGADRGQFGGLRLKLQIVHEDVSPCGLADRAGKFHMLRVEGDQQPTGQQPLEGAGVVGLGQDRNAARCLGDGSDGGAAELGEQVGRLFGSFGHQGVPMRRITYPVLQGPGRFAGGCRRLDRIAMPAQFTREFDDVLAEGRLAGGKSLIAAAQPERIRADDVLEAGNRQVEPFARLAVGLDPVDQGQVVEPAEDVLEDLLGGTGHHRLEPCRRGCDAGVVVGDQVYGLQHAGLWKREVLQRPLHTDAGGGAGGQSGEIRHWRGDQIRPGGEKRPQRVITAVRQICGQRTDRGHQINVTPIRAALSARFSLRRHIYDYGVVDHRSLCPILDAELWAGTVTAQY